MNQTVFKKILLILDGVDTSMAAAKLAVKMAKELGSTVTALYIVDTPTMDYLFQQHVLLKEERDEMEKDLESSADHYLRYVGELGRENGCEIGCISRKGRLSQVCLQLARESEASAIVLGACPSCSRNEFSGLERALLLAECPCPVILVRN